MIYGSTGATHFDQLANILTGYEITGAQSSGIYMGILSIAVGSLFKITAVPFRAAVERTTGLFITAGSSNQKRARRLGYKLTVSYAIRAARLYMAMELSKKNA
ncbi:hypothetical protein AAHE18_11G084600 [Arachis hypogaea]|uniref:NADH:quinone oxidoreductase/Mrp antiporter transmembrane domain-containing protein n=1 Tax=Arachis hypogaea TaxID=3818 RepID=A0A445AQR9_ARAHY|nr:hypothetical protein Ahy_B01g052967 [Arachis hypogaea]